MSCFCGSDSTLILLPALLKEFMEQQAKEKPNRYVALLSLINDQKIEIFLFLSDASIPLKRFQ